MELTMAEKRQLMEQVSELTWKNVLNTEDRDQINCICVAACNRELAKLGEEA